MKMNSGLFRFTQPSATRRQTAIICALILAAIFYSTGCSKSRPPTAAAPPTSADTNPAAADMPREPVFTPAPVVVAASPDGGVDLKQLNHAYVGWIVQTRRSPGTFEEYVAMSGVKVPPPPPGKKFVIDQNGFINLANK
jgi:hypothetical protein